MASATKCGHCSATSWEVKTIEPIGGNYRQNVLQCANCGVPIGTLDFFNLGNLLQMQEKHIAELKRQLDQHGATLRSVQNDLRNMRR